MPSEKQRKPKFGDAWKNVKSDPREMDSLFEKFVKQPKKSPEAPAEAAPSLPDVAPIPAASEPPASSRPTGTPSDNILRSDISLPSEAPTVRNKPTVGTEPTVGNKPTVYTGRFYVDNAVADQLMERLAPLEKLVYFRLYRLSYGFNRDRTDPVGATAIARWCGISKDSAIDMLKSLSDKGLIHLIERRNSKTEKGSIWQVFNTVGGSHTVGNKPTVGAQPTVGQNPPIKDDDDFNSTNHQKETMRIYQNITQNEWRKSDEEAYRKIKDIPLEVIEQGIQVARERATSRPNSLAYFVKEILNQARASEPSRAPRKPEASPPEEPEFDEATRAAYEKYLAQEAETQLDAMTPAELAAARRALLTESVHREYYQTCQASGTLTPEVLRKGLIAERRQVLQANCSLIEFAERRREGKA